jgi:hypothetical protein
MSTPERPDRGDAPRERRSGQRREPDFGVHGRKSIAIGENILRVRDRKAPDRRRSPEDAESNEVVKKDVQARVRKMDLCGAIYTDGWGDEVMCILPAPCVRHSPEDVERCPSCGGPATKVIEVSPLKWGEWPEVEVEHHVVKCSGDCGSFYEPGGYDAGTFRALQILLRDHAVPISPEDVRGADVGEARESLAAELEGARDAMMVDEDWEPSYTADVMTRAAAALRSPEPAAEPRYTLAEMERAIDDEPELPDNTYATRMFGASEAMEKFSEALAHMAGVAFVEGKDDHAVLLRSLSEQAIKEAEFYAKQGRKRTESYRAKQEAIARAISEGTGGADDA